MLVEMTTVAVVEATAPMLVEVTALAPAEVAALAIICLPSRLHISRAAGSLVKREFAGILRRHLFAITRW